MANKLKSKESKFSVMLLIIPLKPFWSMSRGLIITAPSNRLILKSTMLCKSEKTLKKSRRTFKSRSIHSPSLSNLPSTLPLLEAIVENKERMRRRWTSFPKCKPLHCKMSSLRRRKFQKTIQHLRITNSFLHHQKQGRIWWFQNHLSTDLKL